MRGLGGDRLLKRFFGSILPQPRFNPPQVLEPEQDNAEETTTGPSDPQTEHAPGKREAEKTEDASEMTISFDL